MDNQEPSTSSALSSQMQATTSTSFDSRLTNMPRQDIVVFGLSSDLNDLSLPTKCDILKYYFFLSDRAKFEKKKFSYKTITPHVTDKLIQIWCKLNIEIINRKSVFKKLTGLLDKYQKHVQHKNKRDEFKAFADSINELFYIGKCNCHLKTTECSCGLIPEHLKEFMMDQHNERKLTITQYTEDVEEVATTIPTLATGTGDPTYEPPELHMDEDENEATTEVPEATVQMRRGHYTQRYDALNFAMMCDRFGVSDRVASCLATALFEDINFRDVHGNLVIMDKSKVAREKVKSRDAVLRTRHTNSSITAFSFDGRKDDSITTVKINDKFHTTMVKEAHLVVLKEPYNELLGYVNLGSQEDAKTKHRKLNEFFNNKTLTVDQLIGICSDGEPANTGTENGVLRLFEKQLNTPIHWFICLLHFNELPFRHLYEALDKTVTSGPRAASGKLFKAIQQCEKLQVVADFDPIPLENMPAMMDHEHELELSTDVKYLYEIAKAISNGIVPVDLANIKPGPIAHSRWLTKASRLLRLYVTTNTPSTNLKTFAVYIITVYVPMYFNVKFYNSVVYGSALLFKFIRWTRYLQPNLRNIVDYVIQNNSYYAHPENILLTMLFDDRKAIRDRAIKKILHYREKLYDPSKLRVYKKNILNFDATDYVNMVDMNNDDILFEPAFTRQIPYDHLVEYLDFDEPPLADPQIPMHIQGTERHVQLLTSVSKRVIEKNGEGVMAVTLESRKKTPRMESKKDLKK